MENKLVASYPYLLHSDLMMAVPTFVTLTLEFMYPFLVSLPQLRILCIFYANKQENTLNLMSKFAPGSHSNYNDVSNICKCKLNNAANSLTP